LVFLVSTANVGEGIKTYNDGLDSADWRCLRVFKDVPGVFSQGETLTEKCQRRLLYDDSQ